MGRGGVFGGTGRAGPSKGKPAAGGYLFVVVVVVAVVVVVGWLVLFSWASLLLVGFLRYSH